VSTAPSKTAARVGARLLAKARVYRRARVSLLPIAPERGSSQHVLTAYFAVVYPDAGERYIDAKTRFRSRERMRDRAAADTRLV